MTMSGGKSDIAMNEVNILRSVDHPAIIRLLDVVETDSHIYIVLELAVGGELFDKIIQVVRMASFQTIPRPLKGAL